MILRAANTVAPPFKLRLEDGLVDAWIYVIVDPAQ